VLFKPAELATAVKRALIGETFLSPSFAVDGLSSWLIPSFSILICTKLSLIVAYAKPIKSIKTLIGNSTDVIPKIERTLKNDRVCIKLPALTNKFITSCIIILN